MGKRKVDVNRGLRKSMALDLRVKGYSQAEIAHQLGVTQPTVSRMIKAALGERQEMSIDAWRKLEEARIEALERTMWQSLGHGNTQAALVLARLMERRAKLFGLDMPIEAAGPAPIIEIRQETFTALSTGREADPSGESSPAVAPELTRALAAEQRTAPTHATKLIRSYGAEIGQV